MKVPDCRFESDIVLAAGRGDLDRRLLGHLAACDSCREVAAIAGHIRARLAGIEPGYGLADEAGRLWHISRSLPRSADRKSVCRSLVFARNLSLFAPPAIAVVILRDRLVSSGMLTDVSRIVRYGLDYLPVDGTVAFAGALFIATALAFLRVALSD